MAYTGEVIIPDSKMHKAADLFAKNGLDSDGEIEGILSECMSEDEVKQVIAIVEKYDTTEDGRTLFKWFYEAVNEVLGQEVYKLDQDSETDQSE